MLKRLSRTTRHRGERGFVIAVFALMLTTLLVFAGFSIDVGAWYSRGSQAQRAADAAALAGVVWMPDLDRATAAALAAAERNGFVPVPNEISIAVNPVPGNARRLLVTVTDHKVDQYFSKLVMEPPSITRRATAEYVLPVPLGSPTNQLGGQNHLWASISGQTARHQDGDPYSTRCSGDSCTVSQVVSNPNYRPDGYLYAIEVPPTAADETLEVLIYDAGNYNRVGMSPAWPRLETADYQTSNIQFELFRADSTPLDVSDNLVPSNSLAGQCAVGPGRFRIGNGEEPTTYRNQWAVLCRVDVGTLTGQWFLQVKTSQIPGFVEANHTGFNQYAVRATLTGGTNPRVYAVNDMSLFNNVTTTGTNVSATFYLAEVEPLHAGKTFQINLFDPGDGTGAGNYFLNIVGPGGTQYACVYGARGQTTSTSDTCRIQTRNTAVTPNNQYNNQWLDIEIQIPNGYTCTDCWWTIRYDFQGLNSSSSPYDRTTWSASIVGDPVRLIE